MSPQRQRVLDALKATPGLPRCELAQLARVTPKSAQNMLVALGRAGLVKCHGHQQAARWYLADAELPPVARDLVLACLRKEYGKSRGEIALATGLKPKTTEGYLQVLRREGLAHKTGMGRGAVWMLGEGEKQVQSKAIKVAANDLMALWFGRAA